MIHTKQLGCLPIIHFTARGVTTLADATLMM
jgi:pyridoxal 5'-phosphate synthase pdxS subunit